MLGSPLHSLVQTFLLLLLLLFASVFLESKSSDLLPLAVHGPPFHRPHPWKHFFKRCFPTMLPIVNRLKYSLDDPFQIVDQVVSMKKTEFQCIYLPTILNLPLAAKESNLTLKSIFISSKLSLLSTTRFSTFTLEKELLK